MRHFCGTKIAIACPAPKRWHLPVSRTKALIVYLSTQCRFYTLTITIAAKDDAVQPIDRQLIISRIDVILAQPCMWQLRWSGTHARTRAEGDRRSNRNMFTTIILEQQDWPKYDFKQETKDRTFCGSIWIGIIAHCKKLSTGVPRYLVKNLRTCVIT